MVIKSLADTWYPFIVWRSF